MTPYYLLNKYFLSLFGPKPFNYTINYCNYNYTFKVLKVMLWVDIYIIYIIAQLVFIGVH